jgi:nucleoside-diphosphate-sugar epimerase
VIAILGATGYVGRSLARHVAATTDRPLTLFARKAASLADERWRQGVTSRDLAGFDAGEFELVINAIGPGEPARVEALGGGILEISDNWDRRVLGTMGPRTRYVFVSSGAIYGAFDRPADGDAELRLPMNRLASVPPYTLAKLAAESRHRFDPRPILDLRIFAYADASIPHGARFFLAELAACIARATPFETSPADMVRDYAGAAELWNLIACWSAAGAPNLAADLYSAAPASKSDILQAARERFGLVVRTDAGRETGNKAVYASSYRIAETFGYRPRRTSLEIVLSVLDEVAMGVRAQAAASGPGRRG